MHGSGIVRGDTHGMIGLAGVELLGGAVELPQVKDRRTLFPRSRTWRSEKCRYTKQQAKRLQAIRPSVRDERFVRECHSIGEDTPRSTKWSERMRDAQ